MHVTLKKTKMMRTIHLLQILVQTDEDDRKQYDLRPRQVPRPNYRD